MERRQIAATVGAGLFTTGGAATWQSVNPSLPATTAVVIRLIGIFGMATGLAIFVILFVTARNEVGRKAKRAKLRRDQARKLADRLNEGMELFHRTIASDQEFSAWNDEQMVWRQNVAADIALATGLGTARAHDHITGVQLGFFNHRYNDGHNNALLRHSVRVERLRNIIAQLERED